MSTALEHVNLVAPDISCSHCVATIQNTVSQLDGVVDVHADEQSKQVEISFDPARVSLAEITGAMEEEGYPVSE